MRMYVEAKSNGDKKMVMNHNQIPVGNMKTTLLCSARSLEMFEISVHAFYFIQVTII